MINGYTAYDQDGKPYMGLMIENGPVSISVYLAHREFALNLVTQLTRELKAMANDLIHMQDQIVVVKGVDNAAVRKPEKPVG